MTLSHINSFDTGNPAKLGRQLSDLEDNIDAEMRLMRRQLVPQPNVATFMSVGVSSITPIQPDQQLSLDTSTASAAVVFPPLKPANFGRPFRIIKRQGANSIVTSCSDSTVLCNGVAFPTLAAVGLYVFYCDASGYYR